MVVRDKERKTYTYLSRYAQNDTVYNDLDKKRYYETAKRVSKNITTFNTHIIKQGDSLDSIALKYYNNPLLWWIIADINNIQDSMNITAGKDLIIPDLNQIKLI